MGIIKYITNKRIMRLWRKNIEYSELLKERDEWDSLDLSEFLNTTFTSAISAQKSLNRALKAAVKKGK